MTRPLEAEIQIRGGVGCIAVTCTVDRLFDRQLPLLHLKREHHPLTHGCHFGTRDLCRHLIALADTPHVGGKTKSAFILEKASGTAKTVGASATLARVGR